MTNILYFIIVLLLVVIAHLVTEIRKYKKEHDYYVSVDEENARLRGEKKITE